MKRVALTVEGGCPILEALETRLLLSTTYVAADALIDDDCARPSEEIQSAHAAADADEESLLLQGGTLQRDGLPQRKAAPTVVISEVDTGGTDWIEFTNVSTTSVNISGWQITWYDWNSYPAPQGTFTIPGRTICAVGETFVLTEQGTVPGTYPNFYTGTNISWNNNLSGNEVVVLLQDGSGDVVDVMCAVDGDPAAITSPISIPPIEWMGPPVSANTNTALTYQRIGSADHNDASDWTAAAPSPGTVNPALSLPFMPPEVLISEVDTGSTDWVEFTNVSAVAMDVSGWQITWYDWNSYPAPGGTFTIPKKTICAAGETFVLTDGGTAPGTYPNFYTGTNIWWNNSASGNEVVVLLQDDSGGVMDVMCAVDGYPAAISSPVSIPATEWQSSPVPAKTNTAATYQRVGFADNDNASDWIVAEPSPGAVNSGLEIPFPRNLDFGDAPSPYPTTRASDGARHAVTGPSLGPNRDDEADGRPTTAADGDDAAGTPDDEDGVTFGSGIMVGQLGAGLTVNVRNAPAGARLDAWIDFNADGTWGGAFEQIADNLAVSNGDNEIRFDVPSWAVAGTTYARFRLSTAGDLAPVGAADDGEVEDYQVTLMSPAASAGVFGQQKIISTAVSGPLSVFAADVDGDGDMDVLSASFYDDKIAWYENDGSGGFTEHAISTTAEEARSVFAADVDGDGDMDVLSASYWDHKIAWYENDGSQGFTEHTISTSADWAYSVFAADVDGDGDMDVLSTLFLDDEIVWYENDGSEGFTEHLISTAADGAASVFAADVDGDGDMDVLSASFYDGKIAWYENDGSEHFTAHTISTAANGAESVFAADVDGDGDMDVLSASYYIINGKIAWYENDGSQNFTAHTISTDADGAQSVFAADVDGDGDLDVLSASYWDHKIAWYENDGSEGFTAYTITTAAGGASSVFAADVDGDGDLDVLSASSLDDKIAWYENVALDFGDAPPPYPTTFASDGARHVVTGPSLGANRDDEADGRPTTAADGDDTTGAGDDEDGVTFGSGIMVGQLDAELTLNVQNAPAGARLDAWIDFNADGTWGGAFEQIADNLAVSNGDNTITFDVPSWAIAGTTYARFRLSTTGDLAPVGAAADGEVEDYQVTLMSPAAGTGAFGQQEVISTAADGAHSVFAADVDGDGDMDVLSASNGDNKIAWYENDGSQGFTEHTISTSADWAYSVFAADVDGDGDMDVLSASHGDNKITWYENDGSETFTAHTISTAVLWACSVFAADVDGDGDLDVLSASADDDKIAWYENDGSEYFTAHTISTAADGARSVFAADVDGDGDMDVLSASYRDDEIAWYENDGSESFTDHTISTAVRLASSVSAADVDGDGDMDVLAASELDRTIVWYENDGSQGFIAHTISTAIGPLSVSAADVDGDGDMDILSASYPEIAWYENDGSEGFTAHTISTAVLWASSVFAADVDGDGDLDVLSASANDDKIAWYENVALDFGDAPPPYPTTFASDGARHSATGPSLGVNRDHEADGRPTTAADGDDTTGAGDDEDGVTFGSGIMVGQLDAELTVNVQNAPAGARLDAWIDFNADGTWGGAFEQIADNLAVSNGDNTIAFDVPSWAIAGTTYARFRLSTTGDLAPAGAAADGEVEDYQVTLTSPAASAGVFGHQNTISMGADEAWSVFAADVDGDGDMDVLSASASDDKIAWYENDGSQGFTERVISTDADEATAVFAADVDGDGCLDVLSASYYDDKIAWYENDGSGGFTEHPISTAADGPYSVFAADVDGDGDMDVLSASALDRKIAWYENDGSGGFTEQAISTAAIGAVSVFAADVDGDGDMDVLSASRSGGKIAWYENDGSEGFTEQTISTAAWAWSVFAADVDGDGDMDVLCALENDDKIAWYENDGSEHFTERAISTAADGARSVFAADVDGDGDLDVLSASYWDDKIAWYENDGSGGFTEQAISTAARGAWSVFAADVDGDGDLDVLSASLFDGKIAWYENDPETEPPTVEAWYSAAEHGEGVGEALLEVPDDGTFSEPRTAGVSWLRIEFSEAIDPASFTPTSVLLAGNDADNLSVDLLGIDVSTSTTDGDTVGVINFAPALPDVARYLVQIEGITDVAGNPLAGDNDRIFTALAGDAMSDLRVNAIDLSYIWPRRTIRIDGVSEDQTRSDVNCDGRVNAIDLSATWPRRGGDMRDVPDPVLPDKLAAPSSDALAAAAVLMPASGDGDTGAPAGAADATGAPPAMDLTADALTPSPPQPAAAVVTVPIETSALEAPGQPGGAGGDADALDVLSLGNLLSPAL